MVMVPNLLEIGFRNAHLVGQGASILGMILKAMEVQLIIPLDINVQLLLGRLQMNVMTIMGLPLVLIGEGSHLHVDSPPVEEKMFP